MIWCTKLFGCSILALFNFKSLPLSGVQDQKVKRLKPRVSLFDSISDPWSPPPPPESDISATANHPPLFFAPNVSYPTGWFHMKFFLQPSDALIHRAMRHWLNNTFLAEHQHCDLFIKGVKTVIFIWFAYQSGLNHSSHQNNFVFISQLNCAAF